MLISGNREISPRQRIEPSVPRIINPDTLPSELSGRIHKNKRILIVKKINLSQLIIIFKHIRAIMSNKQECKLKLRQYLN